MSNYPPQPQAPPPLKKPRRNRLCINLERTQNLLQLKRFPDCGTNTQRVANANTPGYSFNFTDGDRLKWKRTAFNRCFESVEMRRGEREVVIKTIYNYALMQFIGLVKEIS